MILSEETGELGMQSAVRTGVCPYKDYEKYKQDLESNGYKVLDAHESSNESGTVVQFTYIRVHQQGITMFSQ